MRGIIEGVRVNFRRRGAARQENVFEMLSSFMSGSPDKLIDFTSTLFSIMM